MVNKEYYKMSTVNSEGKTIIKDIPKDLYTQYVNMGWKDYKETKSEPFKKQPKLEPIDKK